MTSKLNLVVCENYAAEVNTILSEGGFDDVNIITTPLRCNAPCAAWGDTLLTSENQVGDTDQVCWLGGFCISSATDIPQHASGFQIKPIQQCFEMIMNPALMRQYQNEGAYLLTPGWLANWSEHIKEWGFTNVLAREFFNESASKLVLLDTGTGNSSENHLKEMAEYLDLPAEILSVGIDYFRLYINNIVLSWRAERQNHPGNTNFLAADYAMAFQVLGDLTAIVTECEVIAIAFDLFHMLFAPDRILYLPINNSEVGEVITHPADQRVETDIQAEMANLNQEYELNMTNSGFKFRIGSDDDRLGVFAIGELTFPVFRNRYLNLAINIGKVLALAVTNARHFSKLQSTRESLEQSELLYRSLFENAPVGISLSKVDGQVVAFNQTMHQIFGCTADEFRLINAKDIYDNPEDRDRLLCQLTENGFVHDFEVKVKGRDGDIKDFRMTVSAITLGNQNLLLTVSDDITERKKDAETLKLYSEHLQEMVQERSMEIQIAHEQLARINKLTVLGQIAGSVSHELRTPLGVISNVIYLLKMPETNMDETTREYIELIAQEVQKAKNIVSDLLEFGRTKTPNRQRAQIQDIINRLCVNLPTPENINLLNQVPTDLPAIFVDIFQIEQVLTNLMTNAYQAMLEGGELLITAHCAEKEVFISLKDNGTGISPENMAKIFEPLFTTKNKGIGLGLALSKNLVEANDGRIEVTSTGRPGEGSCFTLCLPVDPG